MNVSSIPTFGVFFIITKLFMGYELWFYFMGDDAIPLGLEVYYPIIKTLTYSLCFSNILRQACLVLMSNTSHYFGDVQPGGDGVLQQNQSISTIVSIPPQLLCWGFGATHILHHLVPPQNFLTRTFVYFSVASKIEEMGLRVNDTGSVYRGNRRAYTNADGKGDSLLIRLTGSLWIIACLTIGLLLLPIFDVWIQLVIAKVYGSLILRRLRGEKGGDLYGRRKGKSE